MIITINDHPEMLKAFEGLPMDGVPITTRWAGERTARAPRSSSSAAARRARRYDEAVLRRL